jgi:hypothetical protein
MVDHGGFETLAIEPMLPFDIVVVARRTESLINERLMRDDGDWRRASPFEPDRVTATAAAPASIKLSL